MERRSFLRAWLLAVGIACSLAASLHAQSLVLDAPLGENENSFAMADWNYDGLVDSADLALWQQNYDPIGPGGVAAAHTPEPATLLLLALGGLLLLLRRRKRSL